MYDDPSRNPYTSSRVSGGVTAGAPGVLSIQAASRTGLIITFALVQGLLVTAGICGYLGIQNLGPGVAALRIDTDSILFLAIGFGIFFINCVLAVVLPMVMKSKADMDLANSNEPLPQPLEDDTELPTAAQTALGAAATRRLISQALLEGGAIINAIFMLIESNLVFAIPVAIAVVGIGVQAPLASRVRAMLENAAPKP